MKSLTLSLRAKIASELITDAELAHMIEGTPDRRYALVKRALARGELIQIRRGLYCFAKVLQRSPLNTFEIAQKIYHPSYVSLESALSYHGLIPERVYTTTSVCFKRSRDFETSVGHFSFTHIPKFSFLGVDRVVEGPSIFLLASTTRALADYVIAHKTELSPYELFESLRIERESWPEISAISMAAIAEESGNIRLKKFAKHLVKDLSR